MLDLRYVTENLDEVRAKLARRGFTDASVLDAVARLADERRAAIGEVESARAALNVASGEMAKIADKKSEEFQAKRDAARALGDEIKALEARRVEVEHALTELLLDIPNLPDESTPDGKDERDNVVVRSWGDKPTYDFAARDHVELGVSLGILDFDRAAKLSGARFTVLRGVGARLERALMQLMLDLHADQHGYEEVWVPALVKGTALRGTTQLPKFEKDLFKLAGKVGASSMAPSPDGAVAGLRAPSAQKADDDEGGHELYLVPTAEVPVTNLHADEILDVAELPKAYAAYTPCFRSEAGSYGRDTRGMIRQHQFDKVELVRFVTPEQAIEEHEKLTGHAEAVLQALGLHYRVVALCAGDLGFGAKKCYDLEVWLPGQDAYREISSCSWFGDFQARRMAARFRPAPKAKPQLLHTINGSALAIGRTLVALLEQGQQADGSVRIPEALRPYVGGRELITS